MPTNLQITTMLPRVILPHSQIHAVVSFLKSDENLLNLELVRGSFVLISITFDFINNFLLKKNF